MNAATILKITLNNIYNNESDILLSLINSKTSIENAENVVNDPNRPMMMKYFKIVSDISLLFK